MRNLRIIFVVLVLALCVWAGWAIVKSTSGSVQGRANALDWAEKQ